MRSSARSSAPAAPWAFGLGFCNLGGGDGDPGLRQINAVELRDNRSGFIARR